MIVPYNDGQDWMCTDCGTVTHRTRSNPMPEAKHSKDCKMEIKIKSVRAVKHEYELIVRFASDKKVTENEILADGILYDADFPGFIINTKLKEIKK